VAGLDVKVWCLSFLARAAAVAAITLTFPRGAFRLFVPVCGQRAPYIILRFGELARFTPDVTLVAPWRDQCPWHCELRPLTYVNADMCERFTRNYTWALAWTQIRALYGLISTPSNIQSDKGCPIDLVDVVVRGDLGRALLSMHWVLIPGLATAR